MTSRSPTLSVCLSLLAAALVAVVSAPVEAQEWSARVPVDARWVGEDGEPLPFRGDDEVVAFLRDANVVSSREFGEGITGLRRLELELDGVRARAAFHHVEQRKHDQRMDGRYYRVFFDSYRGQCAAYAVARLLGMDNVPPVVCRTVEGEEGSVQLWVEGALLESERLERRLDPPVTREWMRQRHRMRLLDALIFNDDRHADNYLYDRRWKLWLIDHTRAFQVRAELLNPDAPILCERDVWDRLRSITSEQLRDATRPYLEPVQLSALVRRHELLVERIQGFIAERGEGAVILESTCLAAGC